MLNSVTMQGRLVKEPEIQVKDRGEREVSWCRFRIAVTRDYRKRGEEAETDFFTCVAFGNRAIYLKNYGKKGGRITIQGELHSGEYTDKEGKRNFYIEISVHQLWVNDYKENMERDIDQDTDLHRDWRQESYTQDEGFMPYAKGEDYFLPQEQDREYY